MTTEFTAGKPKAITPSRCNVFFRLLSYGNGINYTKFPEKVNRKVLEAEKYSFTEGNKRNKFNFTSFLYSLVIS